MDPMLMAAIVGVAASVFTQAVKREKAGALENILLAGGATVGGTQLAGNFGWDTGTVLPVVFSYAWHGLMGGQAPMQALKFGTIDKLFEGIGATFSAISSRPEAVTHVKAPKCPKDGLFMAYVGRWNLGASTAPMGEFRCRQGHSQVFGLPWTTAKGST